MTPDSHKDRLIALVTGASRGLGAAISAELASTGFVVAGVGRDKRTLEERAASIGRDQFRPFVADLTDQGQLNALIDAVRRDVGDPAIVVNNAGYGGPYGFLHDTADSQWEQVISTNVTAPFMLMRACIPAMAKARFGRIINISSVFGNLGGVGSAAYTAAKHALVGLTKAAAAEYAHVGITCNAVCPGFCETEMTASLQGNAALLARIPAGRFGTPGEIANLVRWLASTDSGYMNGAALLIDGGLTADLAAVPTSRASF